MSKPSNTTDSTTLSKVELAHHLTFESLKQKESEVEFWSARKLAKALEYSEYRHFSPVIEKAKKACANSENSIDDHFQIVQISSGAKRSLTDVRLSRFACYLIVQNGDPSKPVIANCQTYFAIQTRRQELSNNQAGVETPLDFAAFQNHGYKGLYGGLDAQGIHQYKGLKKSKKY